VVFFDEADALGNRGIMTNRGPGVYAQGCRGSNYVSSESLGIIWKNQLTKTETAATEISQPASLINRFVMGAGGGGGAGMGTLQALLTELSGLKKPRGFFNRVVRRTLGMRPKNPPKYRILVVMATNMPESLDEALLRPGRIDRMYRVGYPSKAGRIRTYQGYFDKISHNLTAEDMEKLAIITPYATGATIKDLVNESLIMAIRNSRTSVTWSDVLKAKQLKQLGPSEDVEYIERERHATAIHEACHAVMAYQTRKHLEIDIATIEKGAEYLGMVASIPPDDQFTHWKSEYESDILVSLASLAGERMFFDGDNSSGVSGDLESATTIAGLMEGYWGMGSTVSSYASSRRMELGAPGGGKGRDPKEEMRRALSDRIEDNLGALLARSETLLRENRKHVLAVAHALETHKTLSGNDVHAVIEGRKGDVVNGEAYFEPTNLALLEEYHKSALQAHKEHRKPDLPLPVFG
jgi:cell division protease FtsH